MTSEVIEKTLSDPDYLIQFATTLKVEKQKRIEAEHRNFLQEQTELQSKQLQAAAPKVQYVDTTLQSVNTLTTTQVAKEMGMDAHKMNKMLAEIGILFRQSGMWMLTAKYQNKGYTKTRTQTYTRNDGSIGTSTYTVWTERGRMFLHQMLKEKVSA